MDVVAAAKLVVAGEVSLSAIHGDYFTNNPARQAFGHGRPA